MKNYSFILIKKVLQKMFMIFKKNTLFNNYI